MECRICKSIDHEFNVRADICDQCSEAIEIIGQEAFLIELIDIGWCCITPNDKIRDRNNKDGEIEWLKLKVQELSHEREQ